MNVIVYNSVFIENVQNMNSVIGLNVDLWNFAPLVVEFINTVLYIENTVYEIVSNGFSGE